MQSQIDSLGLPGWLRSRRSSVMCATVFVGPGLGLNHHFGEFWTVVVPPLMQIEGNDISLMRTNLVVEQEGDRAHRQCTANASMKAFLESSSA